LQAPVARSARLASTMLSERRLGRMEFDVWVTIATGGTPRVACCWR
jgi:hypothetical protein